MKRFIALGRVIHLMGAIVVKTYKNGSERKILTAAITVRCPDDENRFKNLSKDEAAVKEKQLVEKILMGRLSTGVLLKDVNEKPIISYRSGYLKDFSEKDITEFENQLSQAIINNPALFFKFNPQLTNSLSDRKRNEKKVKLVEEVSQP